MITIKPYLYGGIISRLTNIPNLVSAVSGLGTLFINKDLKTRNLVWHLYHTILAVELGIIMVIEILEYLRFGW